jgi:glycosidase
MNHIIVTVGQRFLILLIVFGLMDPGPVNTNASINSQPSIGAQNSLTALEADVVSATEMQDATSDNEVDWAGLRHDSRDTLYRTPTGPVETNTSVTLRLRAASGDLTAARVRVFNDRQNTISILDMSQVADDGTYQWWQVTLQPASLPTVYWYRFIAIDGSDVDYYADGDERLGGMGTPSDEEIDNSWQLTFYDPAFQTPDWVKNAIIYQLFLDRFRDGNSQNNTPVGSFYYGEQDTIYRSNSSLWNRVICDPLNPSGPCPGVYGENFYGGDLQGVINKLDYLQGLGITAISLNPIFRSPSNHGYDTINYQVINDSLGDTALLTSLITQAAAHGIFVILDGAFNYTSSDSVYFDLYKRYLSGLGACESPLLPQPSYYRDWYFFYDVFPGTGPCMGSDGTTANAADYIPWNGIDSLPLLDSTNHEVQEQFWKQGISGTPIAPNWLGITGADGWRLDAGGEIDPGILGNLANEYWEGFRTAIHAVNPSAYIVGEEWGNATSWTLGNEWDASTNYQFSTAVLGFWRSESFVDNDHYTDSPAGIIEPLSPSQLNERLLNLQERYAPEAFAAMMNLLDSQDTNRALFMLDPNTYLNDSSIYKNPYYNWSNALTRLRGAVLLQMTLPGAPTIYYGDEVGLVGPATYDTQANTWQDDPYNRMPYPWLDQSGTPYYTHLQTQDSQNLLLNYYKLLTSTRNAHPALRTGSFDPILWDHPYVYAYGRRSLDPADAAIVVLNRSTQTQSVTLDLSGYLPATSILTDVLHNNAQYTVSMEGILTLPSVPAMSGVLLIFTSGNMTHPAAPSNLIATESESRVNLTWGAVADTARYHVFRSLFSDGGYELIGTADTVAYTDINVQNGLRYYYVVRAENILGMVSGDSNQASALPHWAIDWANLQSPAEITHTIGLTATQPIVGQIDIEDVTVLPGATDRILAQVGYGFAATPPADWSTWIDAPFESDQGECDQFAAPLTPEFVGDFNMVFRYSTTGGRDWVYADLIGPFTGTPVNPGILHVLPTTDVTPPSVPGNLRLVDWGNHLVSLAWDPVPNDPTLYAYDVYRSTDINSTGEPVARVLSPTTTYTDTQVASATTYYYRVRAIDTSFNRSSFSNQLLATTTTRQVTLTINVDIPPYTPGEIFIVGDHPKIGSWDPGKIIMTRKDADTWTITLTLEEGVLLSYKYTRGNNGWLNVETSADGNTELPNRTLLVDADSSGIQVVNDTVANWRDPLVANTYPANHATEVPINPIISVTWNQAMDPDTIFTLRNSSGEISGTYAYNPTTWTVSFTPAAYLQVDTNYTIIASYQADSIGDPQLVLYSSTFTTIESITIHTVALPMVRKN